MNFNKRNGKNSVKNIKEALTYLDLEQLNNKFSDFVNTNYNFFFEQSDNPNIVFANDNSFKIIKRDNSEFGIEFIPNCISPKKIIINLINLEGNLEQSYIVKFNSDDVIKIINRRNLKINQYNNDEKIHKKYEEFEYVNSKLRYNRKIENVIGIINDYSYSKETTIYYPNLNKEYIKSQISIGIDNSFYPSSVRCEKYDGEEIKSISLEEFNNIVNNKITKNKILKLKKNS